MMAAKNTYPCNKCLFVYFYIFPSSIVLAYLIPNFTIFNKKKKKKFPTYPCVEFGQNNILKKVSPFLDKLLQLMMAAKNTYPCISVNIL
jgi:hypothetical protein